jgi:Family of unknown function (DUF6527)
MNWIDRVAEWFRFLVDPRRPLEVEFVDDAPDALDATKLYLVGNRDMPWSAMFACPCGCKATIALSLIQTDRPHWCVRHHSDDSVSLSPSIWRTRGCCSHFFLRRGKVVWALAGLHGRGRRR